MSLPFRSTMICWGLPPNGDDRAAPDAVASCGRSKLDARSYSCCSVSPSPDSASCRMANDPYTPARGGENMSLLASPFAASTRFRSPMALAFLLAGCLAAP